MAYRTGFSLHRAADGAFDSWYLSGCSRRNGRLTLDPSAPPVSGESGSGGDGSGGDGHPAAFVVGEATSPVLAPDFPFRSCVPSWNADVPDGSWFELSLRIRSGGRWSGWKSLGPWAPNDSTVRRHSVAGQDDDEARVATDTVEPTSPADAFQARFRFNAAVGADGRPVSAAMPGLRSFSLAYSDPKPVDVEPSVAFSGDAVVVEGVPRSSQMVYPDGGKVWCSPTSVSMVLGYWAGDRSPDGAAREARVRAAVAGVYDHVYGGYGNWSFNVAYAGSAPGMEAYVARFEGLDRLEPWLSAGVPLVLSVAWDTGAGRPITAAPVPRSSGHLTTLVGFTARGDAVMHEPASPSNDSVRRVYDRRELESRWLAASGGAAYVIFPSAAGPDDRSRLFASTIGRRLAGIDGMAL